MAAGTPDAILIGAALNPDHSYPEQRRWALELVKQVVAASSSDPEVAEALGVGLRTFERWKAEYPEIGFCEQKPAKTPKKKHRKPR